MDITRIKPVDYKGITRKSGNQGIRVLRENQGITGVDDEVGIEDRALH